MRGALGKLAAATQSHRGCVEFKLYESLSAPGTFVTVETWESLEDHESHMQTEDLAAALAAAEGHVDGDVASACCDRSEANVVRVHVATHA